jgi:mannose-6-phosphate isomerase-like protein (cupin superfamily)
VPTAPLFAGRKIPKPWGWELVWAECEHYVGKILHIEAGEALSYQFHRVKDETIHLLSGVLDLEWAEDHQAERQRVRLCAGQSVRIRPGMCHRLIAVETCEVLEASTPHLEDVVRLEDRYGRADGT